PAYSALHRHVLHEVLARRERTYQEVFRRVAAGDHPGFPRFQGTERSHSFPFKEDGNGARLDNGFLVRSKMGPMAVRWCRPLEGTSKTLTGSPQAQRWDLG